MRLCARTLAAAAPFVLAMCAIAFAQTGNSVVRGEVTDISGGVLPGVTVEARTVEGRVLATTVTDAEGRYVLSTLPAGVVKLLYQLEGFDTGVVTVALAPGVESQVVERLRLARVTEQVVVYGRVPVETPPPAPPYHPPPPPVRRPPPPPVMPVPTHDVESVCGPAKPSATPQSFGTIQSHRYEAERSLYGKGDELVIDAGTLHGLGVGENFAVRRHFRATETIGPAGLGEHTSGLLQIVAVTERSSTAVVVYACDEVMKGDFLGAFTPEPVRTPERVGVPAFDDAIRILFADSGQILGAPRRLMVIDRGSEQGIKPGQRLTLFRVKAGDTSPFIIGEGIVVAARSDSATIRVESANDAIWAGDWAAPQRQGSAK